jgi:hypothetical protein
LFQSRSQIRREAERQKQAILNTFEKMRRKGHIDRTALSQFGIALAGPGAIKEEHEEEGTMVGGGAP